MLSTITRHEPALRAEFNGSNYVVNLDREGGDHLVRVIKTRRGTATEYHQTIKPGSNIWKRAVRLALNGGAK